MSGHTAVNLKDVEDAAPKFGMSDGIEARFANADLGLEKLGMSYQRLAPGFRIPFGHTQKEQEEVYVVVSGSGRFRVEDEIFDVKPLDAVRVAASATRGFEAGPDGIEIIAFGAPLTPPGDGEMISDWWTD